MIAFVRPAPDVAKRKTKIIVYNMALNIIAYLFSKERKRRFRRRENGIFSKGRKGCRLAREKMVSFLFFLERLVY